MILRHFISLLERVSAGSLRVWIIVGLLLRITRLRDRIPGLQVVFYTTPWPMLVAGFLVLSAHGARLRRWHEMRRYILFAGGAVLVWVSLSWSSGPTGPLVVDRETPRFRVAFWNVARPTDDFERIARRVEETGADIVGIAESEGREPAKDRATVRDWTARFPQYRTIRLPGEMLCLVKGDVLSQTEGTLAKDSFYGLLRVRVRGTEVHVLMGDIYGGPFYRRGPALVKLAEIARPLAGQPLLVLGDFNTPADSAYFRDYRAFLTHTFAEVGHGFYETWPVPLPVLSIDHLWHTPRLQALRCELPYTLLSDHRMILADFAAAP